MFSSADAPVKVVALLLMFAFCAWWYAVQVVRATARPARVDAALHLGMSVVMLLMVLPVTWTALVGLLTLPGLVALSAAVAAWYLYRAVRTTAGHRGHAWGHAAMFGAMVWHLAGMLALHRAMSAGDAMGHGGSHGGEGSVSSAPMVVALVGVPLMAYLLASGLVGLGNPSGRRLPPKRVRVGERPRSPGCTDPREAPPHSTSACPRWRWRP